MRSTGISKMETTVMDKKEEPETLLRDEALLARIRRNMGKDSMTALLAIESLANFFRTYAVLYDLLSEMLAPYDLSPAKYNLLAVLYSTPEHRHRMCEISEHMSVTRTNITKLVDGLERDGLVRRTSLPGDRRVVITKLTPRGKALMEELLPKHYANVGRLLAGMSEAECRQLTHLTLKLRQSAGTAMKPSENEKDCLQ